MLFIDGYGSYVTLRFLEYCYHNRIIVAVYPPHLTHRLQPLEVSLFASLAVRYSQQLQQHISDSEGFCSVSKRDFFRLFWPAYNASFTAYNIESAFRKTSIHPFDPNVILHIFKERPPPSRPASSSLDNSNISASNARKIKRLFKEALEEHILEDSSQKITKFSDILTTVIAQNSILKH
jgi:hypothetical protein